MWLSTHRKLVSCKLVSCCELKETSSCRKGMNVTAVVPEGVGAGQIFQLAVAAQAAQAVPTVHAIKKTLMHCRARVAQLHSRALPRPTSILEHTTCHECNDVRLLSSNHSFTKTNHSGTAARPATRCAREADAQPELTTCEKRRLQHETTVAKVRCLCDYNDSGASISVTSRALFTAVAPGPVTPITKIEFTDGARAGWKVTVAVA